MRSRKTHDVIFGIIDVYIVTAVVVKLLTHAFIKLYFSIHQISTTL